MKKLGKKLNLESETIEAFFHVCGGCYCDCYISTIYGWASNSAINTEYTS